MAFIKIRAFQMVLIILMASSVPFLYSSCATNRFLAETTMAAEEFPTITKEPESHSWFNRFRRRRTSVLIVEKREIPTGPDPLHHHKSNPTGP